MTLEGEAVRFALNYGFAGLMAILFWRYITDVQKEQTKMLNKMNATLERINERLRENDYGE